MQTMIALALLVASACASVPRAEPFDADFTGRALRIDFVHCGTASEEHVAAPTLRLEGEWPGSRSQLVDTTNSGKYRVEMRDAETSAVLYSRGYASIFGEWETTGPAKTGWGAFEECQRVPEPRRRVDVRLEKRAADGGFREIWRLRVDPSSRFVDRSPLTPRGEIVTLFENGAPREKVDLLVLADGYVDRAKFEADAKRLVDVMFATQPFARRKADFNVRGLFVQAAERGISNPRKGEWRAAPLGTSFNAFDVDRYVLTFEDRALRELAAQAPYDALIVLIDERKYGGGGIFNLWATCTADSDQAPYVFVHEFGHSFAGLADEYYSSAVAYETFNPKGVEPWEPNVTALLDPKALKWRDLVDPATPLPTPWKQAEYDAKDLEYQAKRKALVDAQASEEQSEALMREIGAVTGPMLRAEPRFGQVGAFEGASYEAKGLYRSELDCIMFTRNQKHFCRVCERALERVIDLHAR